MLVALVSLVLSVSSPATLTITVWPDGPTSASHVRTLHCEPARGTLVRAAAACRRLATMKQSPFLPLPPGTFCSQIYSGPQEALVRGTFRGRRVSIRFTRRNGCETARWNRLAFLFAK
jgi:Subtilisin inhibitor-like